MSALARMLLLVLVFAFENPSFLATAQLKSIVVSFIREYFLHI